MNKHAFRSCDPNSDLLHWIIVVVIRGHRVINIKILTVCKINQNVSKSFIHFVVDILSGLGQLPSEMLGQTVPKI